MSETVDYPFRTAEPGTAAAVVVEQAGPSPTTPGAGARVLLPAEDGTPDLDWADLRDPVGLRARDRKGVIRRISGQTPGAFAVDLTDGVMAMLVLGWSLPYPPPATRIESLGDLTLAQENALQAHPYVDAAVKMIRGEDSPLNPAGATDPESPSVPSAG